MSIRSGTVGAASFAQWAGRSDDVTTVAMATACRLGATAAGHGTVKKGAFRSVVLARAN